MNEFLNRNKNKLSAATAAVILGALATHGLLDKDSKKEQPAAIASVSVDAVDTIGRSDSGWDQGAAKRAIEKGLKKAAKELNVKGVDFTEEIDALPTYDESMEAVEKAREDGAVADKGDKMKVFIEVTADSDNTVSYEVTDAEIIDVLNNEK